MTSCQSSSAENVSCNVASFFYHQCGDTTYIMLDKSIYIYIYIQWHEQLFSEMCDYWISTFFECENRKRGTLCWVRIGKLKYVICNQRNQICREYLSKIVNISRDDRNQWTHVLWKICIVSNSHLLFSNIYLIEVFTNCSWEIFKN
jgi:hypothetical protein